MLEARFRPLYQRFLVEPVATKLAKHFSPNSVSIASLWVGLLAAVAVAMGWNWGAVVLLLFSGYLDTLDGSIARLTNNSTPFGTMLDITCDRMVEFAIIVGLFAFAPEARGWPCLMMLGSVLIVVTTFLTAGMFMPNEEAQSASQGTADQATPKRSSGFAQARNSDLAPRSERDAEAKQSEAKAKETIKKSFNYTPALMERPEAFAFFIAMLFLPEYFDVLAYAFTALVLYTAGLRMWQTKQALEKL